MAPNSRTSALAPRSAARAPVSMSAVVAASKMATIVASSGAGATTVGAGSVGSLTGATVAGVSDRAQAAVRSVVPTTATAMATTARVETIGIATLRIRTSEVGDW